MAAHLDAGGGGAVAETRWRAGRLGAVGSSKPTGGLYRSARLAVAPAWRGRGIATALVAAAEDGRACDCACRASSEHRLVLLDNRRLFAACGFVETTREAHPGYAEPTFVNMEKRLAQ